MASIINYALETLIAQHLRAWISYTDTDHQLYCWRTKAGLEVDFIVYGETHFYAIEVKSVTTIHTKDLRSLKEFTKDYPMATPIYLYTGTDTLKIDNILCIPIERFLKELFPNQPLTTLDTKKTNLDV